MIIALLLGLSVSIHCSDAYDPLNPHESMYPWKSTKSQIAMHKKRLNTAQEHNREAFERYKAAPRLAVARKTASAADLKEYHAATDAWARKDAEQLRAYRRYENARYYAQPAFPRIERLSDRFSNWVASWYR